MSGHHDEHRGSAVRSPLCVDVGAVAQLPPGSTKRVPMGDTALTLANIGGSVVAFDDLCLRCSSPLSSAALRGSVLTCLHCGWQYDLERSHVIGLPSLKFESRAAQVVDGRVLVATDLHAGAEHIG